MTLLARALDLDDDYPDDMCPGCRQPAHTEAMYIGDDWCPWNSDYFKARLFRRQYIAKHHRVAT